MAHARRKLLDLRAAYVCLMATEALQIQMLFEVEAEAKMMGIRSVRL
jgi:hypothetical protein